MLKILIIAAVNEESAIEALPKVMKHFKSENIDLLITSKLIKQVDVKARIINSKNDFLEDSDFDFDGDYDISILQISHVSRSSYKSLVKNCLRKGNESYLLINKNFQKLDSRECEESLPKFLSVESSFKNSIINKILLFRPSDKSIGYLEKNWIKNGIETKEIHTIAELDESLTREFTEVFFNLCITDLPVIYGALLLCLKRNTRVSAYLTIDLSDICEDNLLKQNIRSFYRSFLSHLDFIYVMKTRSYLVDRYDLKNEKYQLLETSGSSLLQPTDVVVENDGVLRLIYHGLHYCWHELGEFLPVFEQLRKKCKVKLDIFGRVHESLTIGEVPLFPEAERHVRAHLEEYAQFPEVTFYGFASIKLLNKYLSEAHFYIGLTRLKSHMAESEYRTGIIEVSPFPLKVLHKKSPALDEMGLIEGKDYLNIDSGEPERAIEIILEHYVNL